MTPHDLAAVSPEITQGDPQGFQHKARAQTLRTAGLAVKPIVQRRDTDAAFVRQLLQKAGGNLGRAELLLNLGAYQIDDGVFVDAAIVITKTTKIRVL